MKKVLVVEDNETLRYVLRARLEKEGFSVDTVGGGLALLSYLKDVKEPDAVVLDLFIPEKSGIELLDSLVNKWESAAIFIYSAHVQFKPMCLKYPSVCRFFNKTENIEYLVTAIKEKLET